MQHNRLSKKTWWGNDNTLGTELAELSGKTNECTKTSCHLFITWFVSYISLKCCVMADIEPTDLKPAGTKRKCRTSFYGNAAEYWSSVPATVDGVLGGFGFISQTDIKGSLSFLKQLFKLQNPPGHGQALDCGAGIGRITKHLLLRFFDKVDLVEQNASFLEESKNFIGKCHKVGNMYCAGLQDFSPEPKTYDVIWCQWVLGHLTDEDFVGFMKSCKRGLKPNGIIVVKENLTSSDKVEVDKEDSSITRPVSLLQTLLKQAGLHCIKQEKQNNFPRGLYTVKMFALVPDVTKTTTNSRDHCYITEPSVTSSDNGEISSVE